MLLLNPQDTFGMFSDCPSIRPSACEPRCGYQHTAGRYLSPYPCTRRYMRVSAPSPTQHLFRHNNGLVLRLDMSGFIASSVSVELQGRRLHIQAQRPIQRFSSHWESLFDPQALEPAFSRTFVLEPWVDLERVSATLKKSFLEVKLPRKPVPKHSTPRRIVIVSGGSPKEEEAVPATRSMQTVQVQPPTDTRSASKSHPQEGPADNIMLDVKRTIKHDKEQTSEKKIIDIADAQTAAKLNKGKGPATEEQLATWEEERRLAERLRRQDEEDGSVEDCEF